MQAEGGFSMDSSPGGLERTSLSDHIVVEVCV